jgi:lysophospholipase L1-like esterase
MNKFFRFFSLVGIFTVISLCGAILYFERHRAAIAADILFGGDIQRFNANMRHFLVRQWEQTENGVAVLIGDSHIQSLHVSVTTGDLINLGIGGERVLDIVSRIGDYQNLAHAYSITICVGANDALAGHSEQQFEHDVKLLLRELPMSVPLQVAAIPPIEIKLKNSEQLVKKIDHFNRILQVNCANDRCLYIPFPPEMIDKHGYLKSEADSGDHLHLSAFANRIWANSLLPKDVRAKIP